VRLVLVMASGAVAMVMKVAVEFVCAGFPESVTVAVKLNLPRVVGVPVTAPAGERVSPVGRLPEVIDQV